MLQEKKCECENIDDLILSYNFDRSNELHSEE